MLWSFNTNSWTAGATRTIRRIDIGGSGAAMGGEADVDAIIVDIDGASKLVETNEARAAVALSNGKWEACIIGIERTSSGRASEVAEGVASKNPSKNSLKGNTIS